MSVIQSVCQPLFVKSLLRIESLIRFDVKWGLKPPYLVAVDAHVMGGDEGLEDDHPASIGGALEQRVGHLGDVHVGGVGGRHEVCGRRQEKRGQCQRSDVLVSHYSDLYFYLFIRR